jgi:hypothetical protein
MGVLVQGISGVNLIPTRGQVEYQQGHSTPSGTAVNAGSIPPLGPVRDHSGYHRRLLLRWAIWVSGGGKAWSTASFCAGAVAETRRRAAPRGLRPGERGRLVATATRDESSTLPSALRLRLEERLRRERSAERLSPKGRETAFFKSVGLARTSVCLLVRGLSLGVIHTVTVIEQSVRLRMRCEG